MAHICLPAAVRVVGEVTVLGGVDRVDAFGAAETDDGKELLPRDKDGTLERIHIV